jgi:hypothetical protein
LEGGPSGRDEIGEDDAKGHGEEDPEDEKAVEVGKAFEGWRWSRFVGWSSGWTSGQCCLSVRWEIEDRAMDTIVRIVGDIMFLRRYPFASMLIFGIGLANARISFDVVDDTVFDCIHLWRVLVKCTEVLTIYRYLIYLRITSRKKTSRSKSDLHKCER